MKEACRAIVLGLFLAGVTSSCRSPTAGILVESYPSSKITVNSRIVGGVLQVTEVNAARRENGLLQTQVTVQNVTQKDFAFEYRFEFQDANGMKIENSMSVYVPVAITAGEKAHLVAVAPAKSAEDYYFVVRFQNGGQL